MIFLRRRWQNVGGVAGERIREEDSDVSSACLEGPVLRTRNEITERTWSGLGSTVPLRFLHAEAKGTPKNPNAAGQSVWVSADEWGRMT